MNESEIKRYLAGLAQPKLAELLYEALGVSSNASGRKLLLSETGYYVKTSPASVSLVVLPPKNYVISSSNRNDLLNYGVCIKCKIEAVSITKEAICPVCGEVIGLT